MRISTTCVLAGLIIVSVAACIGRGQPLPGARESRPVAAPPPPVTSETAGAAESFSMPIERIERPTLLDEQIEAIRAAVPAFNSVIVRDPGVSPNYPMLPPMTLKNVTVGQFLRFVEEAFPGVQCRRIEGPNGSLFAIRIRSDDEAVRRAQLADESNRVRFFRLGDVIRAIAAETKQVDPPTTAPNKTDEQRIKEATDHVLSLLQIALDQTAPEESYTLKLHEPTLTLLFKGSAAKQAVLHDALASLYPRGPWQSNTTEQLDKGGRRVGTYDEYDRLLSGPERPGWGQSSTPAAQNARQMPSETDKTPGGKSRSDLERMAKMKMDQQERAHAAQQDAMRAQHEAEVADLRAKLAELQRATTRPTKE